MMEDNKKTIIEYLEEKKLLSNNLLKKTSQKTYFKGQVDLIDEILKDIKERPTNFK